MHRIFFQLLNVSILLLAIGTNYFAQTKSSFRADGEKISIEFDNMLRSRVISRIDNKDTKLGDYSFSEFITTTDGKLITDFRITDHSEKSFEDKIGKGKEFKIIGSSKNFTKTISIKTYNDFPSMLVYTVTYKNTGSTNQLIKDWTNNHYTFSALPQKDNKPFFWSYQPGSYGWDNDWIQALQEGFERENYLGMNRVDYGGGTPVLDVWREDVGLAIGHVETVPKLISLPTSVNNETIAEVAVKYENEITLKPGESLTTFRTFVSVHKGDYYKTLTDFSNFMESQGVELKKAQEDSYGTEWCGWGFEEKFTMEQFYGALPMVKKLGIDWATLDMGWEERNYGDYTLPENRFPNGDMDMRKIVDSVHAVGLKARLWWMPLSVYPKTDMFTEHPEYMLLDKNQSPVYIDFWKSFFLCPAYEEVKKITKEFVVRAIKDWGWDGLKIDGNNLNAVPPCYNPAHKHAYPEESGEKLQDLYKMIYETALSINPNAVIQICPCGTNQSFYNLPYMNQTVASDPHNSWHVRIKGKTLRGLTRGKTPYAGDHVELSDNKSDFASTVGIGGVIATKFVWPIGSHENKETGDITLTAEKEKEWAKWIKIYNENMLSKGEYLGELYDIGYDRPETHAIKKGYVMYYAIYADNYDGQIELRGLENKAYNVFDYENNIKLGEVKGPIDKLDVKFEKHLLIKALPK